MNDFFNKIREFGLYRQNNRWIAGVCSGISNYFDLNVFITRLIFIILGFLLFPVAILTYVLLWIFLPDNTKGLKIIAQSSGQVAENNNTNCFINQKVNMTNNNPYVSNRKTYNNTSSRNSISATHIWITIAALLLSFCICISFSYYTTDLDQTIFLFLGLVYTILGISIITAGFKGRRCHGLVFVSIISLIFSPLLFGMSSLYSFTSEEPYNSEDTSYNNVVDISTYEDTLAPNSNGEININVNFNVDRINTNGKPVEIDFDNSKITNSNIVSNRNWLQEDEKNNWNNITNLKQMNAKVVDQNTKANITDLGFYDTKGNPVTTGYNNISFKHTNSMNKKIKTEDFDNAKIKYIFHVTANNKNIDILDLSQQWFGFLQKDKNNPDKYISKQLFSIKDDRWSNNIIPMENNVIKTEKMTNTDLNMNKKVFDLLYDKTYELLDNINDNIQENISAIKFLKDPSLLDLSDDYDAD